jgi:transketolase
VDGHDMGALLAALEADAAPQPEARPTMILALTSKGKGVSYMEDSPGWHGRVPNAEQMATAEAEIRARIQALGGPAAGESQGAVQ